MNKLFKDDINFIPDDVVRERKTREIRKRGNTTGVVVIVIITLISLGVFFYINRLETRIERIESDIATTQQTIDDLKDFGKEGYKLGYRLEQVQSILNSRNNYSILMDEVLAKIPENVTITSWDIARDDEFLFTGNAQPNYTPIAIFRESLLEPMETNPNGRLFEEVRMKSASLNRTESTVDFDLEIIVDQEELNAR